MSRVAAVTGGRGAIGGAIADGLAASGHEVVRLDRERSPGAEPGDVVCDVVCDLADEQGARAAARAVLERHGRCDVLVHAAAAFDRASLASLDLPTWRRVQAVNVEAALWLCQELTPQMAGRGFGRVIMIVSDTVWSPPAEDLLPYVASKAALIGVSRSLARSLGGDGITVNCVAPGLTATPAAQAGMAPEAFAAVRAQQALPRTLVPDDVAGVVAFLAGDAAGALTAQTLCADGGLVLR